VEDNGILCCTLPRRQPLILIGTSPISQYLPQYYDTFECNENSWLLMKVWPGSLRVESNRVFRIRCRLPIFSS